MALLLTRFSYTPETSARLIRSRRIGELLRSKRRVGRRELHGFCTRAETTTATTSRRPDNVSMAAVPLAIGSGGALSSLQTTVPLTAEVTLAALGRVGWPADLTMWNACSDLD